MSNDKKNPVLELKITGFVERFVSIIPKRANLRGIIGQPLTETIRIIPEEKYPFKIIAGKARKGDDIEFTFNEAVDNGKPVYVVSVENLKKDEGRYFDSIILKTDFKEYPEISINVYGDIKSTEEKAKEKGPSLGKPRIKGPESGKTPVKAPEVEKKGDAN